MLAPAVEYWLIAASYVDGDVTEWLLMLTKVAAYRKPVLFCALQTEYHHLIGITASLVDTVENTVRGIPVSENVVRHCCEHSAC